MSSHIHNLSMQTPIHNRCHRKLPSDPKLLLHNQGSPFHLKTKYNRKEQKCYISLNSTIQPGWNVRGRSLCLNTGRTFFKERSTATSHESEIIKKKMQRYEAFSKSTKKEDNINISYKKLNSIFKTFRDKISILLSKEEPIEDIVPLEIYKVSMRGGSKKNYAIDSRMRPTPLKIHIEIDKEGSGRILFSQGIIRPNITNCDKLITLRSKEILRTYNSNKNAMFTEKNIYITIEADKEIVLTFQCAFGLGKGYYESIDEFKKKVKQKLMQRSEKPSMGAQVDDDLNGLEFLVRKKPRGLFRIRKNVGPVQLSAERKAKQIRANVIREQLESKDLIKKAIITNRRTLSNQYDEMLKRKLNQVRMNKNRMKTWLRLIKIFKLAKIVFNRFYVILLLNK